MLVHSALKLPTTMGQSNSAQRDRQAFLNRDSHRMSQLVQDRAIGRSRISGTWTPAQGVTDRPISSISQAQDSHSSHPIATFSRQISAQSIPVLRGGAGNTRDISTRDEIFYEQHEERPLAEMEDLGLQSAPITHITASPMPRRSSRIARFGSMIVPRYAASGSSGEDQHGRGEGRSLRRRLSNTNPLTATAEVEHHHSRRLSIFGSLPSRNSGSRSRRLRDHAPISRPFPLSPDASLPPSGFTTSPLRRTITTRTPSAGSDSPPSRIFSISRNARLSRVRRSISSPFEALFPTHNVSTLADTIQIPPPRPSRLTPSHEGNYLLPPLDVTDPSINLDGARSDLHPSSDTEQRSSLSGSPERSISRTDGSRWTERWAERGALGRRENRRMPSMLRGRSSRLIRRDNDGPLPRILHLAATAIAAQLSGTIEQPLPNMQAIGPDDLDASLHNLFRTLQNATDMTGGTHTRDNDHDTARPPGTLPPMNFLRVFRFVSQNSNASNAASSDERTGGRARSETSSAINEDVSDESEGRTVTLVVVGVRSVPSQNGGNEDAAPAEHSLDSLLNIQPLAPSTSALRNGAGGLLRHANGRSRFPHRRRASVGGLSTFPANYDSQRHQRTLSSSQQGSADATSVTGSATPHTLSESPPGPHPPPSTPADPGLSAYSTANNTPSRRPSSASAIQQPPIPSQDTAAQPAQETNVSATEDQAHRVQQRRRSHSEFARHRELGAGAARRNGVVEPDEVDPPAAGNRSWLIYVVGTNLSEDHPALTTPSLFTDVRHSPPVLENAFAPMLMLQISRILLMKTCCCCLPS